MAQQAEVKIRTATPGDVAVCGRIMFEAFTVINAKHAYPADFPNADVTTGILTHMFSSPHFYCVVAELGDRVVGSNCLDERNAISAVGPITVDPTVQNQGLGRKLMHAVLERAKERRAIGVRLVQAAFHTRSFSLYTSLGFDPREQLACVQGRAKERTIPGLSVRAMTEEDLPACNALSARVHGYERSQEVADGIKQKAALVVERGGRITGYTSGLAMFGHSTAESNDDLKALFGHVEAFQGPGILVPTRNAELLRWCLANGMRVVQLMTLMTTGLYNEPSGAWCPSVGC